MTPSITKVQNIEELYLRLNRHLTLAVGYTEIEALPFIIQACRLKPYQLVHKTINGRLMLHKQWIDEYGNSLYLDGTNRLEIVLNDLSIDRSRLRITDLYHGLPIEKVSRISKMAVLLLGRQEDYCLLSLLGIDDYLRTFVWWRGEWKKYSPLYLGVALLQSLGENLDWSGYREAEGKVLALHRSRRGKTWLTQWPPNKEFVSVLKEWDVPALDFINQQGEKH
jgi:hypothetical protein